MPLKLSTWFIYATYILRKFYIINQHRKYLVDANVLFHTVAQELEIVQESKILKTQFLPIYGIGT